MCSYSSCSLQYNTNRNINKLCSYVARDYKEYKQWTKLRISYNEETLASNIIIKQPQ